MKQEIPEGYIIDIEKSNLKTDTIIYKKNVDLWQQLYYYDGGSGAYLLANSVLAIVKEFDTSSKTNKNVFKTADQAVASLAIAQLTHHLYRINGDWIPDWNTPALIKYSIKRYKEEFYVDNSYSVNYFLTFKDEKIANKFLSTYKQLIIEASPILFGVTVKK